MFDGSSLGVGSISIDVRWISARNEHGEVSIDRKIIEIVKTLETHKGDYYGDDDDINDEANEEDYGGPDIREYRGTDTIIENKNVSITSRADLGPQMGPGRPEDRFGVPKGSKGCLLGGGQKRPDLRSALFPLEK